MPIVISDVTDGSAGAFDIMMSAIATNLDLQYVAQRIAGADYANVYLGAMQTALEQSIRFVEIQASIAIQEEAAAQDLALKQAQQDLVEQQALTEQQNTLLAAQNLLNAQVQEDLLTAQVAKVTAETALLTQKTITEYAQTEMTTNSTPGGLVGAQTLVYEGQAQGFKHKAANDALSALTGMWTIFSTSGTEALPVAADTGTTGLIYDMIVEIYNNAGSAYTAP